MKIVTSLSFQGQCREAFEFYAKVLGGRITAAMPYGDAPPDMPISEAVLAVVEGRMPAPAAAEQLHTRPPNGGTTRRRTVSSSPIWRRATTAG